MGGDEVFCVREAMASLRYPGKKTITRKGIIAFSLLLPTNKGIIFQCAAFRNDEKSFGTWLRFIIGNL